MFRITASIASGNDMTSIVFTIYASNVAHALGVAIGALNQMGFTAGDYSLAHSVNLI